MLIDTGPSVNAEALVEALERLGVRELGWVALTHFHLDHAGAAASLLERNPGARLLVDEPGIGFLTAPERLIRSAHRSLGDIAPHYGTMLPVAPGRIAALHGGYELDLGGGRKLRAIHTPGHSNGHYAFHDSGSGAVFCGDALGHFIQDAGYVYPATPAPEFDLEASLASADRLAALAPAALFFAHYGVSFDAPAAIERFRSQVTRFVDIAAHMPDADAEEIRDVLMRDFPSMSPQEDALVRGIMRVNAAGILHFLRNSAP